MYAELRRHNNRSFRAGAHSQCTGPFPQSHIPPRRVKTQGDFRRFGLHAVDWESAAFNQGGGGNGVFSEKNCANQHNSQAERKDTCF